MADDTTEMEALLCPGHWRRRGSTQQRPEQNDAGEANLGAVIDSSRPGSEIDTKRCSATDHPATCSMFFRAILLCISAIAGRSISQADGPLPDFSLQGVALHPSELEYSPNDDLIHPTIIKTEARVKNPLGKYYLYYAPHKHVAISMAYAESLDGPWKEYKHNPVIKGPSAPDIRWIDEHGKFLMWGHRKNSQTELWTSKDGLNFAHHSVSIKAGNIGTRNATYSRVYEYPLERFGSKYIMLYSGFIEGRNIRCIWLAYSNNALNWTQLKTPLVEPIDGEMNDCYGPALLRYKGRNFITYQDHTTWRGGNLKYAEVDQQISAIGDKGRRYILIDPPSEPPFDNRLRGTEFYREGDTIYLYSSASKNPRRLVYGTAIIQPDDHVPNLPEPNPPPAQSASGANSDPIKIKPRRNDNWPKSSEQAAADAEEERTETAYQAASDRNWQVVFSDPCQGNPDDWKKRWFLDGKVGTVVVGKDGMTLTAGPKFKNDAHHMVLWTKESFRGDLKIEYDYTRLDDETRCVNILYIQATGSGKGPYAKDISLWKDLRDVPSMRSYYNNMHLYHISYAAFPNSGEERPAYIRGRRYVPDAKGLKGTDLEPDYYPEGLFATGIKHHITVIKRDRDLLMRVENPNQVAHFHLANRNLPVVTEGRIGLRHMFTRSARYQNFWVSIPGGEKNDSTN